MNSAPPQHTAINMSTATDLEQGPAFINQRFECTDVDTLAGHMTGWSVHLDQLSSGPFQGMLHEIRAGGIQLLRERVNRSLLKRGAASPGTTSFSIPLETSGTGYCSGAALRNGMLLVSNEPSLPELRTPEEHDIAILTVSTEALHELAALDECANLPGKSGKTSLIELADPHYAALRTFLLASFCAAETQHWNLAYAQVRKTLHDAVLLELVHLTQGTGDSDRLGLTAQRRIVSRVRELVMATPDAPLTVLDVCHAVGTSRRKLQYCFEEVLGTQPSCYLRAVRLNAVRRELRRHSLATASVGDVACRWGFWHLSRFAAHYRQLFGELPSDTLKRSPA
jgi:AraC family ethanolamine operon transcriptional activator